MKKKIFFYVVWAAMILMVLHDIAHARTPFTDDMKSVTSPSQQHAANDGNTVEHTMHMLMADEGTSITDSASTTAFKKANATMHKDMSITYSGDTDTDFVRGMIPHHQGAIDMAKVELDHGKDPATRKLAQGIIAAQEKEIAEMKEWLHKNGK